MNDVLLQARGKRDYRRLRKTLPTHKPTSNDPFLRNTPGRQGRPVHFPKENKVIPLGWMNKGTSNGVGTYSRHSTLGIHTVPPNFLALGIQLDGDEIGVTAVLSRPVALAPARQDHRAVVVIDHRSLAMVIARTSILSVHQTRRCQSLLCGLSRRCWAIAFPFTA